MTVNLQGIHLTSGSRFATPVFLFPLFGFATVCSNPSVRGIPAGFRDGRQSRIRLTKRFSLDADGAVKSASSIVSPGVTTSVS